MKKLIITIIVAFSIAIAFSGCRSAEKCPAYGSAEEYQIDRP